MEIFVPLTFLSQFIYICFTTTTATSTADIQVWVFELDMTTSFYEPD